MPARRTWSAHLLRRLRQQQPTLSSQPWSPSYTNTALISAGKEPCASAFRVLIALRDRGCGHLSSCSRAHARALPHRMIFHLSTCFICAQHMHAHARTTRAHTNKKIHVHYQQTHKLTLPPESRGFIPLITKTKNSRSADTACCACSPAKMSEHIALTRRRPNSMSASTYGHRTNL